jgi:acetolactate synthase-1/2/3 large subunit
MDSTPLVCITGQVRSTLIGTDAFQECDITGITMPIVKHSWLVQDARDIPSVLRAAFHVARTGRCGPVLVDVPRDLQEAVVDVTFPAEVDLPGWRPPTKVHPLQIREAGRAVANARKPILYVGGGTLNGDACAELLELAEAGSLPVVTTLMGKGAFPEDHELHFGWPGMHGPKWSNLAINSCDVLVAIGARFDDRVIGDPANFAQNPRKIIHIDIDPSSISKRVKVDVPIVGNIPDVLDDLLKLLKEGKTQSIDAWWKQIGDWRARNCLKYDRSSKIIKPQFVLEKLYEVTKGEAFVTSDVGQHQMWAAQFYKFDQPRRWINSGGLGTMGFGLPAAMGVQLANPGATVACVTGESSIQMCLQELSTCKQYRLPIKVINLNNKYMGMVRQWQQFFHGNRYSESYMDALPDFVKLAEGYGHRGVLVEKPADVEPALREAFAAKNELVFLDFVTDQKENVYPMIPGGKGITEMILYEDL